MNIVKATGAYEKWLGERVSLSEGDLAYKHERMAGDAFEFMRATFYRWVQLWDDNAGALGDAPTVLAVGDLHTDNFGTWRDLEGRLVWGINDFDEAYRLPYAVDLARLAQSAGMSLELAAGDVDLDRICGRIVAGYKSGLKYHGKPFVLAEDNQWLADLVLPNVKDFEKFWEKLQQLEIRDGARNPVPAGALAAIGAASPPGATKPRISRRTAGLGSLGRPRFVALSRLDHANIAREAKELTASSCLWARDGKGAGDIFYSEILHAAVRSPDPFLLVQQRWAVRRLSPEYVRIDLSELPNEETDRVLYAMGWETANVHLGSGEEAARDILKHLKRMRSTDEDAGEAQGRWLASVVESLSDATSDDFFAWQEHWSAQ